MPFSDIDTFRANLLLTQQYCEMQLCNSEKSEGEILRSINPEYQGEPIFTFIAGQYDKSTIISEWRVPPFDNDSIVGELFEKQLEFKRAVADRQQQSIFSGRILASEYDQTVTEGGAESESNGIIDIYDIPPIDTWVYILQTRRTKILFSCIPERFVALVDEGIKISILDILYWIHNPEYALNKFSS